MCPCNYPHFTQVLNTICGVGSHFTSTGHNLWCGSHRSDPICASRVTVHVSLTCGDPVASREETEHLKNNSLCDNRQEAGDNKQQTTDKKQQGQAKGKGQQATNQRQQTRGNKQETRERKEATGNRRKEATGRRDKRLDTGNKCKEMRYRQVHQLRRHSSIQEPVHTKVGGHPFRQLNRRHVFVRQPARPVRCECWVPLWDDGWWRAQR